MTRRTTICVAAIGALALAACDTGDGKQLQPYDPADYPSQTVAPAVSDVGGSDGFGADGFDVDQPLNLTGDLTGQPGPEVGGSMLDVGVEPFAVVAPWLDGGDIDPRHTCDGADIAPAISWGAVPAGTVEIAVALVDESAVSEGRPFVHWVIGGLDPAEIALVEGDAPIGALQALNFFGDVGFGGPCPPPGAGAHLYRLTAYALNQQLELADGDLATAFLDTIATLTIASTDVTGFYQR